MTALAEAARKTDAHNQAKKKGTWLESSAHVSGFGRARHIVGSRRLSKHLGNRLATSDKRDEPSGGKVLSRCQNLLVTIPRPNFPTILYNPVFTYKYWQKMLDTCLILDSCLSHPKKEDKEHAEEAGQNKLYACHEKIFMGYLAEIGTKAKEHDYCKAK